MSEQETNAITETTAHHATPGEKHFPKFSVTPGLDAYADDMLTHYPAEQTMSAVLPILHEVQKQFGYICGDSIIWTANKTKTTPAHVLGVVSFYPGLRQTCPGKFHIRVCRTLACAMAGSEELVDTLCKNVGIDRKSINHHHPVGVSPCGNWSIEFVECLADCAKAPVAMVNDNTHGRITPDKAQELIQQYADK